MDNFGFKDLEEVSLKATYKIELGNRTIEPGETIAYFDKIQIAGIQEVVDRVAARGGFDNRGHVFWETVKEIQLTFCQGVFSKEQFALSVNSRLAQRSQIEPISISQREYLESDDNGIIICKYTPARNLYVYRKDTGDKITYTQNENQLTIIEPFQEVVVDYEFDYNNESEVITIGKKLISGFVSLEGKTRVKDDTTGQIVTGLIKIPHLKLMSDLSIRLGAQANPVVATFNAIGVPVGSRGNSYVSEFYLLSDDITSDL